MVYDHRNRFAQHAGSDALARSTRVGARVLYRCLHALASVGVFIENKEGSFGLSPVRA
jgi:hypothetical protein